MIISVTEQFPTDGRQGGHLVVARGITRSAQDGPDILIRDPPAWGQDHDRMARCRADSTAADTRAGADRRTSESPMLAAEEEFPELVTGGDGVHGMSGKLTEQAGQILSTCAPRGRPLRRWPGRRSSVPACCGARWAGR
ncbi:MAG TPA: hypothetical protein DHU96_19185 [Actinobacteria bacterium]|nr:hypothetical protein [Actinomycetota bacterium]